MDEPEPEPGPWNGIILWVPSHLGLHHVTATVSDAQDDLDFVLETLGLRLVKKTVNFDNHNVYHFYYGDEVGTPGTIWTTFPYKGWNVPAGEKGAGQILATTFSVPAASLDFWRARLERLGVEVIDGRARFKDQVVAFRDPSGLVMEIVGSDDDPRESWQSTISEESAIHGLHSVTLVVHTPQHTLDLMTTMLGFSVIDEMDGRIRVAVNGTGPGHIMDILHDPDATPAKNGIGTVHHVAMAIARRKSNSRCAKISCARRPGDRGPRPPYFKSIYFREQGGVLFEVATITRAPR